ncbi:MAG TPA: 3-oxoacyl-[acyl-carrier-protein] reductase [Chloroflexota bacterium]|jgi:3-oxoacyl-[acyl-carrier protein] reductase
MPGFGPLASKIAVVTGAGRGIGRAIALELARQGANVVVNYRASKNEAESLALEIEACGVRCLVVQADVAEVADVERVFAAAMEQFGRIDILVNNAGIVRDRLLLRMSDDDWDEVLRINLRGAFLCTRAALRPMIRQRGGRIITISSVVGTLGNAGQANYAAAKAGLVGFTRSVAREVASRAITANLVAPGYIETDMMTGVSEEMRARILSLIPLARTGQPQEVAALVCFLASDQAGYITGQELFIDGGMVMA